MAYIGNTARLCQDIVDGELDLVEDWLVTLILFSSHIQSPLLFSQSCRSILF